MIRKTIFSILAVLLVLVFSTGSVTSESVRSSQSAGISATASVVLPLGMVVAESPNTDILPTEAAPSPGSHRFWLYHPVAEGLQIQITKGIETGSSIRLPGLTLLKEYPHVSLVEWPLLAESNAGNEAMTVTITYTNN